MVIPIKPGTKIFLKTNQHLSHEPPNGLGDGVGFSSMKIQTRHTDPLRYITRPPCAFERLVNISKKVADIAAYVRGRPAAAMAAALRAA